MQPRSSSQVEPTWAARVRSGNKKHFDHENDYEVTCKFTSNPTRESVYEEIKKLNWPFATIIGMVM